MLTDLCNQDTMYGLYLPHFVSETSHEYAPLSDHNLITIHLIAAKQKNNNLCGYWKLNINLLIDYIFCNLVNKTAKQIFGNSDSRQTQRWKYFKFKCREQAVHAKENWAIFFF